MRCPQNPLFYVNEEAALYHLVLNSGNTEVNQTQIWSWKTQPRLEWLGREAIGKGRAILFLLTLSRMSRRR